MAAWSSFFCRISRLIQVNRTSRSSGKLSITGARARDASSSRPVAIAATLALHGFVLAGIVAWTDKTIQPPPPQPMRVALVADVATSPAAVHEGTGPAVPEQDTPVPEIAAAPATAAAEPPPNLSLL